MLLARLIRLEILFEISILMTIDPNIENIEIENIPDSDAFAVELLSSSRVA
jgi:hypothetical protein